MSLAARSTSLCHEGAPLKPEWPGRSERLWRSGKLERSARSKMGRSERSREVKIRRVKKVRLVIEVRQV